RVTSLYAGLFPLRYNETKSYRLEENKMELDIQEIKAIIPHRFPFLLVDRITELEEGRRVVGIKNVTANEPYFNGHFPDYPSCPVCSSWKRWRKSGPSQCCIGRKIEENSPSSPVSTNFVSANK